MLEVYILEEILNISIMTSWQKSDTILENKVYQKCSMVKGTLVKYSSQKKKCKNVIQEIKRLSHFALGSQF